MRGLIQFSAAIFIVLGVIVFVIAAFIALGAWSSSYGGAGAGFLAALIGTATGASVVLVGGTAYLLASIDEKLERALLKQGVRSAADELGAAQVG